MNEIIKKLRFGFEIEGCFRDGMSERLNFRGEFVRDGSVRFPSHSFTELQRIPVSTPRSCSECQFSESGELRRYCPRHHARYHSEGEVSTEYASAVFDDLDSCLRDLRLFNKHNHAFNTTCGLHFHVGAKEDKWRQLFGAASNLQYIKQLHKEALHYCDCQKERLESEQATTYCSQYRGRNELKNCTKIDEGDNIKYRFVRFHPQHHTLEFRFLSPCEHKIQNVRKLLASLTSYLGRSESHRAYAIAETSKREDAEIMHEIKIEKAAGRSFDIIKQLHQPNPHENSVFYRDAMDAAGFAIENGDVEAEREIQRRRLSRGGSYHLGDMPMSIQRGRFTEGVVYCDGSNRYQLTSVGLFRLDNRNNIESLNPSAVPPVMPVDEEPFLVGNREDGFRLQPSRPYTLREMAGNYLMREPLAGLMAEMQPNFFSTEESEEE